MWSVRKTAAGAVIVASLSFLTAPVSACDDRFVKKCEKAAAAAAAAAETQAEAPVAKRKRGVAVASRRAKASRFVTRMAPGFAVRRGQGLTLASGSSRTILLPESALARRFRGFIDPQPMAQNAFEILRKPHLVALNLEPAAAMPSAEPVAPMPTVVVEPPVAPAATPAVAAVAVVTTAKQDRAAAKATPAKPPAQMELASAESRPVTLAEPVAPAKPVAIAAADMAPAATAQSFLTESPHPAPADHQPSRFPVHQLVLALCGALGVASALRFIVGA